MQSNQYLKEIDCEWDQKNVLLLVRYAFVTMEEQVRVQWYQSILKLPIADCAVWLNF